MKPALGSPFPPTWTGRPAHMSDQDWRIWQHFRSRQPLPFERLYYDVGLGSGDLDATPATPALAGMWNRLTRFRADAVGETSEAWTLIELRASAGPGALGSLIAYHDLWANDPPDTRPVRLWLITDLIHPDLRPTLLRLSISLFTV